MSMRRLIIAFTLLTACARPAEAGLITWTFSEQISLASGPYAPLEGTDVYGVFSFESNQPTPDPIGLRQNVYTYTLGPLVVSLPALDSVWTYGSGSMALSLSTDDWSCQSSGSFPQCMHLSFLDPTSSNPNAPPPPTGGRLGLELNVLVPGWYFSTGELPLVPPDARVVGGFWNSFSCEPICGTSDDLTSLTAVPEPASFVLIGTGLLGAAVKRRRSRQQNR